MERNYVKVIASIEIRTSCDLSGDCPKILPKKARVWMVPIEIWIRWKTSRYGCGGP